MKNLVFQRSEIESGLQLVDVLCNAIKRAMNGGLQRLGWELIGCLVVQAQRGEQEMPFVHLSEQNSLEIKDASVPYVSVIKHVRRISKPMLVKKGTLAR